jgi:two-component system, cell cycle sensor histidine kinase DivJ
MNARRHWAWSQGASKANGIADLWLAGFLPALVISRSLGSPFETALIFTAAIIPFLALLVCGGTDMPARLIRSVALTCAAVAVVLLGAVFGPSMVVWWLIVPLIGHALAMLRGAIEAAMMVVVSAAGVPLIVAMYGGAALPPTPQLTWALGLGAVVFFAGGSLLRDRQAKQKHHQDCQDRKRAVKVDDILSASPMTVMHIGLDGRILWSRGNRADVFANGRRLVDAVGQGASQPVDDLIAATLLSASLQSAQIDTCDGVWVLRCCPHPVQGLVCAVTDTAHAMPSVHASSAPPGLNQAGLNPESVASMLAPAVHELRTPLNAISGFADMMASRVFGPLPERYAEYAEHIRDSAQHMSEVVNATLDMARIEEGRFVVDIADVDLREPVSQAVAMLSHQAASRAIGLHPPDLHEPIEVRGDARAIRQIVINLVSNAIKFTDQGGSVRVTLRHDGNEGVIEVCDNGAGMSAEEMAQLGERFTQFEAAKRSDAQGSGLGVNLVRALIGLQDGRLAVSSEIGKGSVFEVRLPRVVHHPMRDDARQQLERVKRALADIDDGYRAAR